MESIVFFPSIKLKWEINTVQYNLYQLQARSQYENMCDVWQVRAMKAKEINLHLSLSLSGGMI